MRWISFLVFWLFLAGLASAEMVSVSVDSANIRSMPGLEGSLVILQAPLYYPLLVNEDKGEFLRVEDYLGREGWIAKSVVDPTAGVVVKVPRANVRSGPGTNTSILFAASQGVTFQVLEDRGKWLKVRHESGRIGWIFTSLVWGRGQ